MEKIVEKKLEKTLCKKGDLVIARKPSKGIQVCGTLGDYSEWQNECKVYHLLDWSFFNMDDIVLFDDEFNDNFNNFPLCDLPDGILNFVLFLNGKVTASKQSRTCKKFLKAFRLNLYWMNIALQQTLAPPHFIVDHYNKSDCQTWFKFAELNEEFNIRIVAVTEFTNLAPTQFCFADFDVVFNAMTDVQDFKKKVFDIIKATDPTIERYHRGHEFGYFHYHKKDIPGLKRPIRQEDCLKAFQLHWNKGTIRSAGLFNNALVLIHDTVYCD